MCSLVTIPPKRERMPRDMPLWTQCGGVSTFLNIRRDRCSFEGFTFDSLRLLFGGVAVPTSGTGRPDQERQRVLRQLELAGTQNPLDFSLG
jgi:hypothetical protein